MADTSERIFIKDWKNDFPIIYHREIRKPTVQSATGDWDLIESLADGKRFFLVVDASVLSPPSAEVRSVVNSRYEEMKNQILFIYIFIGKNFLLKIALKFLLASAKAENTKVVNSIKDALDLIQEDS